MDSMKQRRTTKVFALSTSQAFSALSKVIAVGVLARTLTVSEYATFQQSILIYAFAASFLTLGLPNAIFYFLSSEKLRKRGLLLDNCVMLTVMGLIFAVLLLFGGNRLVASQFNNPELLKTLPWIALYAIFALPVTATAPCLTVQNRVVSLAIFNALTRIITLGVIVAVSLVWRSALHCIQALAISEGIILLIAIRMMINVVPADETNLSLQSMKQIARFAVPLGLATMFGTITLQLDKLIVSSFCSPEKFAIYVNGAMQIPFVGIVTGSIAGVILADMRKALISGKPHEANDLFRKAASKAASILLPAGCFLFVFAGDLITLIYSEKYSQSVVPFRLYLFILPVRIVQYGSALMALGLSSTILKRSIIDLLLNVLFSIVFVIAIGPNGAVIATIMMLYVWHVPFNLHKIKKGFAVQSVGPIPFGDIGKTFAAAIVSAMISFAIFGVQMSSHIRLISGFFLFSCTYIVITIIFHCEFRTVLLSLRDMVRR